MANIEKKMKIDSTDNVVKKLWLIEYSIYLFAANSDICKLLFAAVYCMRCLMRGDIGKGQGYIKKKRGKLEIRAHSTGMYRNETFGTKYNGEKIAVYTVLFGNNDVITNPKVVNANCDYYVITDNAVDNTLVWKKLDIDMVNMGIKDDVLRSRYYKMNSHLVFPNYKYSVYLDANIVLYGDPSDLICHINKKTGIAMHNLPARNSVYEEIYAREKIEPNDSEVLEAQKEKYKKEGFRSGEGLFECNVIIRNHNNTMCKKIMEDWWKEFMRYPKRDQVSFPYVLWKDDIAQSDIGIIANNIHRNPYFRIHEHRANR